MFYITPGYITAIILALPKALWKFQLISNSVNFLCIFQFENIWYPKTHICSYCSFCVLLSASSEQWLPFAADSKGSRHSPASDGAHTPTRAK